MQIDERNPGKQYGDWNRAFLQFIMSRSCNDINLYLYRSFHIAVQQSLEIMSLI